MIDYIVYNPNEQIIGFDTPEQVLEYIDEYYGHTIGAYSKEDNLNYDELSAKNVEDFATVMGATEGICRVYAIEHVLSSIKQANLPRESEVALLDLLTSPRIDSQIDCPTDLYELLLELEEVNLAKMISDYADEDRL
ncbi:MAG: hypothetical protein AB9856_21630 [Cellulosilyticaceae bacterium]